MYKYSVGRRVTSGALAAVLAFGGAGMVAGAELAYADNEPAVNVGGQTAATYTAYQVFAATGTTGTGDNTQLTGISWGNGVNSDNLLTALKGESTFANAFANAATAADVANILGGYASDSAQVKKFAELALANKAGDGTQLTNHDGVYKADGVASGYYVIQASGTADPNKTLSSPIMMTTGNIAIAPKDGTVKMDKDINATPKGDKVNVNEVKASGEAADNNRVEADDYAVGDVITHTLDGSLPDNLAGFTKSFKYYFTDTMQKGLTFNGVTKVYITKADGTTLDLVKDQDYTVESGAYAGTNTAYTGGTTFTVKLHDFVNHGFGAGQDYTIVSTDVISVEYTATLNDQATRGDQGNKNVAKVLFTNDINSDGTTEPGGETPEDENVVFTYDLDNLKIGDGNAETKLKDAEFVIKNAKGEFYGGKNADGSNKWIEGTATKGQDGTYTLSEGIEVLKSGEDGKFGLTGIDSGAYTLVETKAPTGYNMPADNEFTFTVEATINQNEENTTDTRLINLKVTSTEDTGMFGSTADKGTGVISTQINNVSGSILPHTGGMGTVAFTVVGVALMAGAIVITVSRRRQAQN